MRAESEITARSTAQMGSITKQFNMIIRCETVGIKSGAQMVQTASAAATIPNRVIPRNKN